jgi:hypothetical protein
MNTTINRYAPALLSFAVLVIGGVQVALEAGPISWVILAQLLVMTVTTATTYLAPLVGEQWRGKVKTGLEILGVVITLALPYIAAGKITPAEVLLVLVAVLKAGATQLGIIIRTDPEPVIATQAGNVFHVTTLTRQEAIDVAADLADRIPGPDHRAEATHLDVPASRAAE